MTCLRSTQGQEDLLGKSIRIR